MTTRKEANKDDKGEGIGEAELDTEKHEYNDPETLEEAIRKKIKESNKDTITIEDVHTNEEDTSVSSSQE